MEKVDTILLDLEYKALPFLAQHRPKYACVYVY